MHLNLFFLLFKEIIYIFRLLNMCPRAQVNMTVRETTQKLNILETQVKID